MHSSHFMVFYFVMILLLLPSFYFSISINVFTEYHSRFILLGYDLLFHNKMLFTYILLFCVYEFDSLAHSVYSKPNGYSTHPTLADLSRFLRDENLIFLRDEAIIHQMNKDLQICSLH